MKSPLAFLLLAVYLQALAQPVLPHLGYWLNRSFIAQNLCENRENPRLASCCRGQCYLLKQVRKAEGQTKETGNRPAPRAAENGPELAAHLQPSPIWLWMPGLKCVFAEVPVLPFASVAGPVPTPPPWRA